MNPIKSSPRILDLGWGSLSVEGSSKPYKDAKLFPGGSRDWDWRETGTEHSPGIQIADVQELLEHGAKVIVFGCGVFGRLGVMSETIQALQERGVVIHALNTKEAVKLYNRLAESEPVGALIHTTC